MKIYKNSFVEKNIKEKFLARVSKCATEKGYQYYQ